MIASRTRPGMRARAPDPPLAKFCIVPFGRSCGSLPRPPRAQDLDDNWNYVLECQQFIGCRKPAQVHRLAAGEDEKIHWLLAEVKLAHPLLGLQTIVVMSLHLRNIHAKKNKAGPQALRDAITKAKADALEQGRPLMDIICGDINMARPAPGWLGL